MYVLHALCLCDVRICALLWTETQSAEKQEHSPRLLCCCGKLRARELAVHFQKSLEVALASIARERVAVEMKGMKAAASLCSLFCAQYNCRYWLVSFIDRPIIRNTSNGGKQNKNCNPRNMEN